MNIRDISFALFVLFACVSIIVSTLIHKPSSIIEGRAMFAYVAMWASAWAMFGFSLGRKE